MKTSIKTKVLFVFSLFFGLLFINAGLNKFLNYMPVPENLPEGLVKEMSALVQIKWLMPLIGLVEIVGGILFILPRTRTLGAIIILPVMTGILLTNMVTDTSGLPTALILFAILLWVIFENRKKYLPLVN